VIPFLGIYPKEHKTGYSRDTCTLMLIAALFTIDKLWRQLRCPTSDGHIYTREYYSAIRKNDIWFEVHGYNWRTSS
jgi:hypothetical protein